MARPHPAMQAVLERLVVERAGMPSRYSLPFEEAREQLLQERLPWLDDGPACACEERRVDVGERLLAMRVYRPATVSGGDALVYLHGGGWCVGSAQTHDNIVRRLATGLGAQTWSVDYALAPEAPYPAGLLDAVEAIRLATDELVGARLVVAGDSAGANLALDAALRLAGSSAPAIDALLLFYGVYTARLDGVSMDRYGDGRYGLSRAAHARYLDAYRGAADALPFALDDAVRLEGLPRIRLVVAELDILRDQSLALAAKLARGGVDVQLDEVEGVIHGFLSYGRMLAQAGETIDRACRWVRGENGASAR